MCTPHAGARRAISTTPRRNLSTTPAPARRRDPLAIGASDDAGKVQQHRNLFNDAFRGPECCLDRRDDVWRNRNSILLEVRNDLHEDISVVAVLDSKADVVR